MDITYITRFESIDIKNWSGTEFYIAKALEKQNCLSYINGLQDKLTFLTRLKNKYYTKDGCKYLVNRSPEVSKGYARQIKKQLKPSTDIVFSPGTIPIAYLDVKQPKVFYTDATFASMLNYYDWFQNLSSKTIEESMKLDQEALASSSLAIFSSDWAARSAINDYNVDPAKVKVIPFGANLEHHYSNKEIGERIEKRDCKICNILFLGVDWDRKGGAVVYETVSYLNSIGLETQLHIVGVDNSFMSDYPYIVNHGFIDKSTNKGQRKIENILLNSHFLFMPSKAEAYGIVFCEASAYGIPSIATNTGGIPTIIKDNLNGMTFDINTSVGSYAKFIYDTFLDFEQYKELAKSSYNEYKNRLNWDVASQSLTNYMKELL